MIAAPKCDIRAHTGKWLNRVVLEDEAVALQLETGKHRRAAAQIGNQRIAHCPGSGDLLGPEDVKLCVAECDKEPVTIGREYFGDVLERRNGTTAEFAFPEI